MNESLTTAEEQQILKPNEAKQQLAQWLDKMEPQFAKALGNTMGEAEFARICMTAWQESTKLQQCSTRSFLSACMTSAQLKLAPNTPLGLAYLIPRGGQVNFQLGYRGAVQLMYRSAVVAAVRAGVVREGDHFIWRDGLNPILEHEPTAPLDAPKTHAWAVIDTARGGHIPAVLPAERIEQIKSRYVQAKSGPWYGIVGKGIKDPGAADEMWKKTVIVRAGKLAPLELEIQRAVALDEMSDAGMQQPQTIEAEFAAVSDDQAEGDQSAADLFKASNSGVGTPGEADSGAAGDGDPEDLSAQAILILAAREAGMSLPDLEFLVRNVTGGPLESMPDDDELVAAVREQINVYSEDGEQGSLKL